MAMLAADKEDLNPGRDMGIGAEVVDSEATSRPALRSLSAGSIDWDAAADDRLVGRWRPALTRDCSGTGALVEGLRM